MKSKFKNRIYAYTTSSMKTKEWKGSRKGVGLIKVGQTTGDVDTRIRRQLQGSPDILLNGGYEKLLDEEALTINGEYFRDIDVFKWLKAMGVNRIQGGENSRTEWFEATIDEVKKAYEYAVSGLSPRHLPQKVKIPMIRNNVPYNTLLRKVEREKIKKPDTILKVMSLYPDAVTINTIAKRLKDYYKITQYAAATVNTLITPVIQKLLKAKVLINEGAYNSPKLVVATEDLSNFFSLEDEISSKPKLTLKELRALIKASPRGLTVEDIENIYNIWNKPVLYDTLGKECIKVKEPTTNRKYSGFIVRYYAPEFAPQKEQPKPKEEQLPRDVQYTQNDVRIVKNALQYLKYKKLVSKVVRKTKMSEAKIKKIVENELPRYIVSKSSFNNGEEAIYRVCSYPKLQALRKEKEKQKEDELLKEISEILEGYPNGLNCEELSNTLNISLGSVYQLLKKYKNTNLFVVVTFGTITLFSNKHYNNLSILLKNCRASNKGFIRKYSITEKDILKFIEDNPYCNASQLATFIQSNYKVERDDINGVVTDITRVLIQEGLIVNLGKYKGSKALCIPTSENVQSSNASRKLNLSSIAAWLEERPHGATTKEVWNLINGQVNIVTLILNLKNSPEIHGVMVASEKHPQGYYKWFRKNSAVTLEQGEVLMDAIV